MVCHSEYCSQYFPSLHPRITYFDSLTRDLLYVYRNGSTPSYWPQQIWKSDTSPKCWSARFRMLSLCRRVLSIYFPLTMSNNYLIIKLLQRQIVRGARFEHQHSYEDDRGFKGEFSPHGSMAERRISFFAQSLTTHIPEPIPVDAIPTFTVLIPRYSEMILLSLCGIIKEEDQYTRVTLLEYLTQLHPVE